MDERHPTRRAAADEHPGDALTTALEARPVRGGSGFFCPECYTELLRRPRRGQDGRCVSCRGLVNVPRRNRERARVKTRRRERPDGDGLWSQ